MAFQLSKSMQNRISYLFNLSSAHASTRLHTAQLLAAVRVAYTAAGFTPLRFIAFYISRDAVTGVPCAATTQQQFTNPHGNGGTFSLPSLNSNPNHMHAADIKMCASPELQCGLICDAARTLRSTVRRRRHGGGGHRNSRAARSARLPPPLRPCRRPAGLPGCARRRCR